MRSIRSAIRRALPSDGEPYEDGPLPDLISGAMWMATGSVGLAVQALPGVTENSELPWVWVLGAFAIVWGGISVWLGLGGKVMPLGQRAVVTAAMMPVVAVALWATGGATSYAARAVIFTVTVAGLTLCILILSSFWWGWRCASARTPNATR
jgi:hypothetical protein